MPHRLLFFFIPLFRALPKLIVSPMMADTDEHAAVLIRWYAEMGVDEATARSPADFYSWQRAEKSAPAPDGPTIIGKQTAKPADTAQPKTQIFNASQTAMPADEAIAAAAGAAKKCQTFEELKAAVLSFEGCALKAGARNTVFADGVNNPDLLVIGEAPGREEDETGKPFVGRAGQLLDRMLAAIDYSRQTNTLITNVVYWRPPGNRTPTNTETSICRPFVERLIELTTPKAILLAGSVPMQSLLGLSGIMRTRGVWREFETASGQKFPVLPIFHPAFLLRQPGQKRLAWEDLLSLQSRLRED